MKKLSLIVASIVYSSSLYASMDMGIVSAELGDGGSNSGFNLDVKGFFHPKSLMGIGVGGSLGMNYFSIDSTNNLDNDAGLSMDLDLLLGYDYKKTTLYVGGGYTLGEVGSATFDGTNYQVGAEYSFTKNYGIGVKYKHNRIDFTDFSSDKTDLDITSIYFKYTK